jgi:hypothetical protein
MNVPHKNPILVSGGYEIKIPIPGQYVISKKISNTTTRWYKKTGPRRLLWWSSVSLVGEFSPNPYQKNMISTYRKDFPSKKSPKFARFRKINSTNRQIIIIRSTK